MIRRLYTVVIYTLIPWIILRLFWKSRRCAAYRHRIAERFFLRQSILANIDIWLHAVSLGEVVAATPLIQRMLANNLRVLVTTMTPTGSQQVITSFKSQVSHCYMPYDVPWCLKRFFKHVRPQIGIIMETELWPNMIHQAGLAKIPLVLVNARLSDHAFEHYRKLRWLFAPLLAQMAWIGAQSATDADRYRSLGAPAASLDMMGNMKFDLSLDPANIQNLAQFKTAWGVDRPVWIAASTHEGEEFLLLSQLSRIQAAIPEILLVIVPRRPERFQAVFSLVQQQGWRAALRSRPETIAADTALLVVDAMGELMSFYQLSDYAFVGGSLVPIGGHNVLEPIAMQVPVFCGPYMQNSKSICEDLVMKQAIQQSQSVEDLADQLIFMYQHPSIRQQQIVAASAFLQANRGTVDRYWGKIEKIRTSCQNVR